jgi:2-hydroxy-6-oxonona-2,4-dienedioate hydrolase
MALTDEGLLAVPGLASRWVRLAGGARAHYMTAGETGSPVVLLHDGLPGANGTTSWHYLAPWLGAQGLRVYCPDLPGFGLSDPRPEHWPNGFAGHVDFIREFADALCLDTFFLGGHSLGCADTFFFVCAHPERVERFAVISGNAGDVAPIVSSPIGGALSGFDGSAESVRTHLEQAVVNAEVVTDDVVAMETGFAARNRDAYRAFIQVTLAMMEGTDPNLAARLRTRDRLDRLTIPGIYVYGKEDRIRPLDFGHAQEDVLPNIQFFYPEGCGHHAQLDRPDLIGQLFVEFLRDGRVTRATAHAAGVSRRRPELRTVVETL